jgi:hypothetical protein
MHILNTVHQARHDNTCLQSQLRRQRQMDHGLRTARAKVKEILSQTRLVMHHCNPRYSTGRGRRNKA